MQSMETDGGPREPGRGPEDEAERRQALAAASQAVLDLPFQQREAFVLYELEGLSGAEVATLLSVPIGTVWTRLHHARKRFERAMRRRRREQEEVPR